MSDAFVYKAKEPIDRYGFVTPKMGTREFCESTKRVEVEFSDDFVASNRFLVYNLITYALRFMAFEQAKAAREIEYEGQSDEELVIQESSLDEIATTWALAEATIQAGISPDEPFSEDDIARVRNDVINLKRVFVDKRSIRIALV